MITIVTKRLVSQAVNHLGAGRGGDVAARLGGGGSVGKVACHANLPGTAVPAKGGRGRGQDAAIAVPERAAAARGRVWGVQALGRREAHPAGRRPLR